MDKIQNYLGAIVLLIGAVVIAVPAFTKTQTNLSLIIGDILVLVGFILHIWINRKAK